MVYGLEYLRTGIDKIQKELSAADQPVRLFQAKGLEESYAPGKRFGGHREVNLISAPVRV